MTCKDCMDEKVCTICQGSGIYFGDEPGDVMNGMGCPDCFGSGKCQWCNE